MSNSATQIKYDVFVSFRGKDVRGGFLSHLIEGFRRKQIKAFVDDKLERGQEISQSLVEAIEESSISLIIFSEDYASSHWCLQELKKILECRDKYNQTVIPIFYHIDPAHVRHQRGSYKDALAKHEEKYDSTRVQMWRQALNTSANLSGINSLNFRNDAELVEEAINLMLIRLGKHTVNTKGLVGIDKLIAHLESLLCKELKDVRCIGIWGMGGIGKTTIAIEIFNKLHLEYDGYCFLANVREESRRYGMNSLKDKLCSSLLKENVKCELPSGLPDYIQRRTQRMKVLVILDDVNNSNQLEELFGSPSVFGSGSRIIVTTRDKQVLIANKVDDIYPIGVLSFDEAFQLFNLNAFSQNHLEMDYELSKMVINYAKGIPLVLKVLGHLLRGKDNEVWQSLLEKLKRIPNKEVHDVIRLSYDDLDREEQKIFLDLACFFTKVNLKVDFVKNLLKGESGNSVVVGLERLKDKALISISEDNKISMHDIIQEMAWEIVRQEDPTNRSRLWDPEDIYDVLQNDKGNAAIRSITRTFSRLGDPKLSPHVFAKMSKLQFFDFYSMFTGFPAFPNELQSFPSSLRYLRWHYYPFESLPNQFSAEKLVILDLTSSKLSTLWAGVKNLVNLKKVKLVKCKYLLELPDFSMAINLQVLDISYCWKLTSVHPSIFSLNKLVKLLLKGCYSLTNFPWQTHSCSVYYLDLPKLEILDLERTGIKSLPSSIKNLTSLRHLILSYCNKLESLPELPSSLEVLCAKNCNSLKIVSFPSEVEQFTTNKKRVEFWDCGKLDKPSLEAIELDARVNVTNFAHQHLSMLEHECKENYSDYNDNYGSYQAMYVYPRSNLPEWLANKKTREDYIIIDLSSASVSPLLAFIFCFVFEKEPALTSFQPESTTLEFNITINDCESEGKEETIKIYTFESTVVDKSDHVCVLYDQRFSCYLNSRAKSLTSFKIKATQCFQSSVLKKVWLKGFGVSPINT